MLGFITFVFIILVTLGVIVSGIYVYSITNDYRRWWFLGISASFIVLGIGCITYHVFDSEYGNVFLMVGMLFIIVLTGVYVIIRAVDKWFQNHNFYLKKWQKQKKLEEEECTTRVELLVQR